MKEQRKQYAPEEKVAIPRRHLLEKEHISKLCDEVGLQPTVSSPLAREFFENGAAAIEQKRSSNPSADGADYVPAEDDRGERRGSGRARG